MVLDLEWFAQAFFKDSLLVGSPETGMGIGAMMRTRLRYSRVPDTVFLRKSKFNAA
jgi:hypothetical protein